MQCFEQRLSLKLLLRRLVCILLMICMLPAFKFDAGAANTKEQYQYVWLISKPGIYYDNYYEKGKHIFRCYSSENKNTKWEMYQQGSTCYSKFTTEALKVWTQFTNETTPNVTTWNGTKFKYEGKVVTYEKAIEIASGNNAYHWAGNISGGSECKVDDAENGAKFTGDYPSSKSATGPTRLNSNGNWYNITFQIETSDLKIGKQQAYSNVSCFLYKSTKPLPNINGGGGGGGTDPDPEPEETEVSASLSLTARDANINYKNFEVEGKGETTITVDPSKSSTNADWDKYTITASDALDWSVKETKSGRPKKQSYTAEFTRETLRKKGLTSRLGSIEIPVSASVVVYADGDGGSANDKTDATGSYRITLTNNDPTAVIQSVKNVALTDTGSQYDEAFYYINKPIRITDASYDSEKQSYPSATNAPTMEYYIEHNGENIFMSDNFETMDHWPDIIENASQNKDAKTIDVTFTEPGYYKIKAYVTDELGVIGRTEKTIYVRGEPKAPTAIINSSNYTFVNYPFPVKDASTDPNDDIVSWVWDAVVPASEDVTGTVSGGLQNATYPAGGNKPTNIGGTLQFSAPGEYKIGLTVTDATSLSDHTEKTIKVIRDIPVAIVEPGPASKDNPSDSDPHYAVDPDDNIEKVYVKQNRKLVLDASTSLDPPASPIAWDSTEWVYSNSDNDVDYNMDSVKVDKSSTKKQQVLLAKDVGEFKVTLTLHNKYSDELSPDDPDLSARTRVIFVKVVPDENPNTTIQVGNSTPNFHDNPQSVEVTITGTATSPDNDHIDYFNWRIYRDNNDDGTYANSELQTQIEKTQSTQVKLPVKFETGNTSKFLAQMDAYERFGQPTIDEYITSDDICHSSSEQEFEVNWRPCISYTMRDFAYVDDTLTITPTLKDENIETCTVVWTLMRKNKAGKYEAVDATALPANIFDDKPIWDLGLHGGNIRITKDGYYRLDAIITDAEGHSETFSSTEIRIYDVPHAVISDKADYRWNGGAFQFKESRKFTLDGNASYVNDSTGDAKHQLNRALDEWSITPLDGQNAEDIYVGATAEATTRLNSTDSTCFNPGKNSFDEVLAILAPGRYRVDYRVTNTYGKRSPITTQEIVIVEDTAPIITGYSQPSVKRGSADDGATTIISISGLNIQSKDLDIVRNHWSIDLIYDAGNDGYQNDSWETVDNANVSVDRNKPDEVLLTVEVPKERLGKYQFRVSVKEEFGQETLPIIPDEKRKSATKTFDTQIDNVQPNGTFSTRAEVKGDVVFAVGDSASAKAIAAASKTFANRFGAEAGMDVLDVNVNVIETAVKNTFEGSFKVHFMWTSSADIDSHLEFYDAAGTQTGHLYYGNKSVYGCSLDIDDTSGGTGEWLTLDFNSIVYRS